MRVLVVGGTGFLGGAITDALVGAGHQVAVLVRGTTKRSLPDGVEAIAADRYGDLSVLKQHKFDWVFDTCAFSPDAVRSLLEPLGDQLQRYVFISSISAYGTFAKSRLNEQDPVPNATEDDLAISRSLSPAERSSATSYGASYGVLKRACELAAEEVLGERATSLRVGLLVGAGDYTDRLTWWIRRIDQGTSQNPAVPAPAPSSRQVQMIDVRDVADFALACAETKRGGIWNVTSSPFQLGDLLKDIISEAGSPARLHWVEEEHIIDAGIQPWTDLPVMMPSLPDYAHFMNVDTSQAEAAGLTCRPLSETLGPLLAWDRTRRDTALKCGLTEEQEAALLQQHVVS
ncbi:NAD-dependent epimerase/dehydratase family protein [Pseudovibrio sp. Ad26]|uniref:NAD-dependent epimerase/dehydratase family protein n=1 Tax=Pseudovibrio sp. Ad26 TaxID=989410 RepID=UPI0007AE87DE|nr:NAD-dependent epimerase/dehydratase family protein [Pseudovibrio sp. Ad26]KZL12704.1 NAD dependent epimerase/dehydratase family protein [Pseudovibrio sp. Ad26]